MKELSLVEVSQVNGGASSTEYLQRAIVGGIFIGGCYVAGFGAPIAIGAVAVNALASTGIGFNAALATAGFIEGAGAAVFATGLRDFADYTYEQTVG